MVVATSARSKTAWAWAVRLAWVAVAVTGDQAIRLAVEPIAATPALIVRILATAFWTAGALSIAVPSVVTLTAARIILPTSLVAALAVASSVGLDNGWIVATLVAAVAATALVLSADLGRAYVQASAYGEEDRHLLRPPAAYLIATLITWLIWAVCGVGSVVAVAHRDWLVAGGLGLVAVATVAWGWRRWHRLSRRWLVFVPVGVVLHDHLVLSDTWMVRRQELIGLRLAPADTGAADLTGPATGHAIEVLLNDTLTVVLAATPSVPTGKAIHLTAALIAPTRPGAALRAAATRRFAATANA